MLASHVLVISTNPSSLVFFLGLVRVRFSHSTFFLSLSLSNPAALPRSICQSHSNTQVIRYWAWTVFGWGPICTSGCCMHGLRYGRYLGAGGHYLIWANPIAVVACQCWYQLKRLHGQQLTLVSTKQ